MYRVGIAPDFGSLPVDTAETVREPELSAFGPAPGKSGDIFSFTLSVAQDWLPARQFVTD
jgi:hypothetical protein